MSSDGVSLNVKVDDRASKFLAALAAQIGNLDPALDEIGASQVTEAQHRFEEEKGPDGTKWKGLAALTVARRGPGAKILRDQGNLFDSVTHQVAHGQGAVRVGSNRRYARIHQLGGKAGRGHKVTIPARPYLGLSQAGRKEIVEILKEHVRRPSP